MRVPPTRSPMVRSYTRQVVVDVTATTSRFNSNSVSGGLLPSGGCTITCPDGSIAGNACPESNETCHCYCSPSWGATCDECR
jgi:hypothetical protein